MAHKQGHTVQPWMAWNYLYRSGQERQTQKSNARIKGMCHHAQRHSPGVFSLKSLELVCRAPTAPGGRDRQREQVLTDMENGSGQL